MVSIATHVMFQGAANEALSLYGQVFPEFAVERIERYEKGEGGEEGLVKIAHVSFSGHRLIVIDSPIPHEFDFTPSISLFVDFDGAATMASAFATLSKGCKVMMPPDNYGFSERFAWIEDRFGVSWQLNVPGPS